MQEIFVPGQPASTQEYLEEQKRAQENKTRARRLYQYDEIIFCHFMDDHDRSTCAGMRLDDYDGITNLQSLLEKIIHRRGRKIQIADMGAGPGIAMRELGLQPGLKDGMETTIVDLFQLGEEEIGYFHSPDEVELSTIMSEELAPGFIQADAEKVVLDKSPDVIISVESIQYLNNPLAAIVNWYNQLKDGGLLIVARHGDILKYMNYKKIADYEPGGTVLTSDGLSAELDKEDSPLVDLIRLLDAAGVKLAAMDGWGESKEFNYKKPRVTGGNTYLTSLIIEKKPRTQLSLNTRLVSIRNDMDHFKNVFYEQPEQGDFIVEVVDLDKHMI